MKHILTFAALLCALAVTAQKGNVGFVYPCGAQRGTTVEVAVGGQNLSKAETLVFSGEGISVERIESDAKKTAKKKNIGEEDNMQLADQVRFRVTIAPDATPGMRDVRAKTPGGLTNRLFFEVGQLPDVLEKEPNDKVPNRVDRLPATVNGQVMRSDADRFSFPAKKGQDLVLNVRARAFIPYIADAVPGWFQPVLRLFDATGREIAYQDDYGFRPDPVLLFKVPADGDYALEIRDALFRGREDFVYRIDVGQLPFITSIFPLGGPSGKKTEVTLRGVNLPASTVSVKPDPKGDERIPVQVTSRDGCLSNTLFFEQGKFNEKIVAKPANTSAQKALPVAVGDAVESIILQPMQEHWYALAVDAPSRRPLVFEVIARRLGSEADMKMTLYDPQGKVLVEKDDVDDPEEPILTHHADPVILQRIDRAGTYLIRLVETQSRGGEQYAYRFKIYESEPDFALNIEPPSITIPRGGSAQVNVVVVRKQNFMGKIDLSVTGLPPGFALSDTEITMGAKRHTMTVTAPQDAEEGVLDLDVWGSATRDGVTVKRHADPVESMMQAFYYTHMLPIGDFRAEVVEAQPFRLELEKMAQPVALTPGKPTYVKIRVIRKEGFAEPVTLMLRSPDRAIKAEAVIVEPDQPEGILEITCAEGGNGDPIPVVVSGVTRSTTQRLAGQNRQAFASAVTALAPSFTVRNTSGRTAEERLRAMQAAQAKGKGKPQQNANKK